MTISCLQRMDYFPTTKILYNQIKFKFKHTMQIINTTCLPIIHNMIEGSILNVIVNKISKKTLHEKKYIYLRTVKNNIKNIIKFIKINLINLLT